MESRWHAGRAADVSVTAERGVVDSANAISQLNQTLQNVAIQHNMDLLDTARLLAAGNMVPTDAGMACFDSKYTYQFWRPITAIRNAGIDGNPATEAT